MAGREGDDREGWAVIETPRLRLVPCETHHFEAMRAGGRRLERALGATVLDGWFDLPGVAEAEAVRFMHEHLRANPDVLGWWTYLFVHAGDGVLVGIGGYKGAPDAAGAVEIGYALVSAYRGRGLAKEAARGLVAHAFAHEHVNRVDAHTLAERNASAGVLERVGMRVVGTAQDPDVGEVWRWSLTRAGYRRG